MTFILAPTKKKIVWTAGLFVLYFVFLAFTYLCPDMGVSGMSRLGVPLPAACSYYFYEGGELAALGGYIAQVWLLPAVLIYLLVSALFFVKGEKNQKK